MDKGSRAEWLTNEMQDEREKDKHQVSSSFSNSRNEQFCRAATWERVAVKQQEGSASVCGKCEKQTNKKTCKASAQRLLGYKQAWRSWEMIDGQRTRVWCRSCTGYAEHELWKVFFSEEMYRTTRTAKLEEGCAPNKQSEERTLQGPTSIVSYREHRRLR